MISPLAYIHPEAKIGENVEIGPFVFIDKNVEIGDNNTIMPNATILYGSRIGNGNTIFPGAVIGAIPQDLKFHGEDTTAEIGDKQHYPRKRNHQPWYCRQRQNSGRQQQPTDGRCTCGARCTGGKRLHYREFY